MCESKSAKTGEEMNSEIWGGGDYSTVTLLARLRG